MQFSLYIHVSWDQMVHGLYDVQYHTVFPNANWCIVRPLIVDSIPCMFSKRYFSSAVYFTNGPSFNFIHEWPLYIDNFTI